MEDLFQTVFERKASAKELIILRRLRKLYNEELVKDAIRLSVTITEGSPIKYIAAVANNLSKESHVEDNLREQTKLKLEQMRKYGSS